MYYIYWSLAKLTKPFYKLHMWSLVNYWTLVSQRRPPPQIQVH